MNKKEKEMLGALVEYEIRSSRWVQYAKTPFLQKIAGKYYVRKTKRKFARLKRDAERREYLKTNNLI